MVKKTKKRKNKSKKNKTEKELGFDKDGWNLRPIAEKRGEVLQFKIKPTRVRTNSDNKIKAVENLKTVGKVYILYTGGTIGMSHPSDREGLVPIKGTLVKLIDKLGIDADLKIKYVIDRIDPLIYSSDLTAKDWKKMLDKLQENYNNYDSFIVLHGTDTMAYTAAILSFFLMNWNKTVIITGSQIPLFEFRTDARQNVIDSIIVSLLKIPEVLLVFGGQIIRGSCVAKTNSTALKAFTSPNQGLTGEIGVHINIFKDKLTNWNVIKNNPIFKKNPVSYSFIRKLINNKWSLKDWNNDIKIYVLTLLPHNNAPVLDKLIELNPDAIILRTYGIGNAPVENKEFINSIKKAINKNIILVNNSQCLNGGVNQTYYHTGKVLKELGVISSKNMVDASSYAKLFYLFQIFGRNSIETIKTLFQINLVGEITVNQFFDDKLESYLVNYFNQYQELG